MKSMNRLTKGIVGEAVSVSVVMIILSLAVIFGGERSDVEMFVLRLVLYLAFVLLACIILGTYLLVVFCVYQKAKTKLRAIPGFSEERFEREAARAPQMNQLIACCDAICYAGSAHMVKVIPMTDILWAYQEQDRNVLQIYTKDRQKHTVSVSMRKRADRKNYEMGIRYLLRLIVRKNKNAIVGFDESWEKMYKQDFQRFLGNCQGKEIADSSLLEQEYIANDYYQKDFQ